jgi:hypothetical protein
MTPRNAREAVEKAGDLYWCREVTTGTCSVRCELDHVAAYIIGPAYRGNTIRRLEDMASVLSEIAQELKEAAAKHGIPQD